MAFLVYDSSLPLAWPQVYGDFQFGPSLILSEFRDGNVRCQVGTWNFRLERQLSFPLTALNGKLFSLMIRGILITFILLIQKNNEEEPENLRRAAKE